jgi:hypothetical protein
VYKENAAPRGQPRGSYSGRSGPTDGWSVCCASQVMMSSLTYTFHEQEPVQFTPCVERTTLSYDQQSR